MNTARRPLSPHLQIYRRQLTSVLSISHRASGVVLVLGVLVLTYWLLALAGGQAQFDRAQALLASVFGRAFLFAMTVALFFHLCNGIRHLFWDAGKGLDIETAYTSGRAVLVATVVLSLAAWIAAYAVRG